MEMVSHTPSMFAKIKVLQEIIQYENITLFYKNQGLWLNPVMQPIFIISYT